jgi:hypothetical protein
VSSIHRGMHHVCLPFRLSSTSSMGVRAVGGVGR